MAKEPQLNSRLKQVRQLWSPVSRLAHWFVPNGQPQPNPMLWAEQVEGTLARQSALLAELGREIHDLRSVSGGPKRRLRFPPSDTFFEVVQPVIQAKKTLLGVDRLYVLWQAVKNVQALGLAAAEVGTFRGGSAYFIAAAFKSLGGQEVEMHVYDTFVGHPQEKITARDPFQTAGMFNGTSYEEVKAYLSVFSRLSVHQGEFSKSIVEAPELTYGFAHLDTDLYEPTLETLAYFNDRLAVGGVLVIDDYASQKCPGVKKAAIEFLAEHPELQAWDVQTEQLVLIKARQS